MPIRRRDAEDAEITQRKSHVRRRFHPQLRSLHAAELKFPSRATRSHRLVISASLSFAGNSGQVFRESETLCGGQRQAQSLSRDDYLGLRFSHQPAPEAKRRLSKLGSICGGERGPARLEEQRAQVFLL